MSFTKFDFNFIVALILAIWFSVAGMGWAYYAALIVGYPAGILSLILWRYGRKFDAKQQRYKFILLILGIGFLLSMGMLIGLLITN